MNNDGSRPIRVGEPYEGYIPPEQQYPYGLPTWLSLPPGMDEEIDSNQDFQVVKLERVRLEDIQDPDERYSELARRLHQALLGQKIRSSGC